MKKTMLLAFAALTFAACQPKSDKTNENASTSVDSTTAKTTTATADTGMNALHKDGPVLNFANESYNFGKIKKGEIVSYSFKFRNTGQVPLIITNAIATCGCTVPETPKDPIKPGDNGELKVVFNSAGKPIGAIDKAITVSSNALNSTVQLHLVGEITE